MKSEEEQKKNPSTASAASQFRVITNLRFEKMMQDK